MGNVIDKTKGRHGKARPWILLGGTVIAIGGIALYAVFSHDPATQILWIIFSYNLFFSIGYQIYVLSHSLMVPLATKNIADRDSLAVISSSARSIVPGTLVAIVMPLMIKFMGVGSAAAQRWFLIMAIISALALPGAILEYFFTRERIGSVESSQNTEKVKHRTLIRCCFRDRRWLIVMLFTFIYNLGSSLGNSSIVYFCNWVMGSSVAEGAGLQVLVNMIGQAPLGIGLAILWPLVRKYGKRKISTLGFAIAALGTVPVILCSNKYVVLPALFIRSFGLLAAYLLPSFMADAIDSVERTYGIRADGFTSSVVTIMQALAAGLSQSILLGGINLFGYISPTHVEEVVCQPTSVVFLLTACFAIIPVICFALCGVLTSMLKNAKNPTHS